MIRPSQLPMLAQCPCYEPKPEGERDDRAKGTERHKLCADYLKLGESEALKGIDDEEAEKVHWACKYVLDHAPTSQFPLRIEERRTMLDDQFRPFLSGTPDVTCGPKLFDFKSRSRDYLPQMASYAWMMLDECPDLGAVECHLLFCETKISDVHLFTLETAEQRVKAILREIGHAVPTPCDYCGWCNKAATCPALADRVAKIAAGREDWELGQYHASKIETPEEMGKALALARHVGKWCDAVEHHAREMAVKRGLLPSGFKLQQRKGKTYISDVTGAFGLAGLPQADFLACCSLRMETSKTYPDQVGIVDTFQRFSGIKSKSAAKRVILEKLEAVVKQGSPSLSLVAERGNKESEGEQ